MTTIGGDGYLTYIEKLRERARLFQEADQSEDDADFYDDLIAWAALQDPDKHNRSVNDFRDQARDTRKKAAELVRNMLSVYDVMELNFFSFAAAKKFKEDPKRIREWCKQNKRPERRRAESAFH